MSTSDQSDKAVNEQAARIAEAALVGLERIEKKAAEEDEPWPQKPHEGPNRQSLVLKSTGATQILLRELVNGPSLNPMALGAGKLINEWRESTLKRCQTALSFWAQLHTQRCQWCLLPVDVTGRCYSCALVRGLAKISTLCADEETRFYSRSVIEEVFALADRDLEPGTRQKIEAERTKAFLAEEDKRRDAFKGDELGTAAKKRERRDEEIAILERRVNAEVEAAKASGKPVAESAEVREAMDRWNEQRLSFAYMDASEACGAGGPNETSYENARNLAARDLQAFRDAIEARAQLSREEVIEQTKLREAEVASRLVTGTATVDGAMIAAGLADGSLSATAPDETPAQFAGQMRDAMRQLREDVPAASWTDGMTAAEAEMLKLADLIEKSEDMSADERRVITLRCVEILNALDDIDSSPEGLAKTTELKAKAHEIFDRLGPCEFCDRADYCRCNVGDRPPFVPLVPDTK